MPRVFVIQKNGKLTNPSLNYLSTLFHTTISPPQGNQLSFYLSQLDIHILFVRHQDIPFIVARLPNSQGIVGEDVLLEKFPAYQPKTKLNFGHCQFCLAIKSGLDIKKLSRPLVLATKYPRLTLDYFKNKPNQPEILTLSGSLEILPSFNICDGIVDLVVTGNCLQQHNLKLITRIYSFQSVLISQDSLLGQAKKTVSS